MGGGPSAGSTPTAPRAPQATPKPPKGTLSEQLFEKKGMSLSFFFGLIVAIHLNDEYALGHNREETIAKGVAKAILRYGDGVHDVGVKCPL